MATTDTWCIIAATFFIITDYITGMGKAIMQNDLNSKKMREGLGHKFTYIILILVSWFIDEISSHVDIGLPISAFVCTVSGICLIELTSILENLTTINPELADAPFIKNLTQNNIRPKHSNK